MSVAHRQAWASKVASHGELSPGAKEVAVVLARAGVVSRVACTDWQGINRAVGRPLRDACVHGEIRELQAAGYLGRRQGNRFHQSRGWRLCLPENSHDGGDVDKGYDEPVRESGFCS